MYQFIKQHRIDIACVIVLFIFACLPRLVDLGTFLTADEKNWIGRSHEFVRAFQDLRFNDMLQTTHPGVPALWVSGIAVTIKSIVADVPYASSHIIYFIKTAQFSVALLTAIAVPCIYLLLFSLFKNRVFAVIATLFIALDPLIVGYSRVIHVDALMGSYLTLAVLASILYAKHLTRFWLVASAVCSFLAILTKIPAIFILPFIPVALIVMHPRKLLTRSFLVQRAKDASTWILLCTVSILLIWPALLWVPNPMGNINQINKDISAAAITPHDSDEEYKIVSMQYVYALLVRSNPVSIVGGIIGCVALVYYLLYKKQFPKEMWLIALYLFGFVLMMTIGAKKGDRYILPAFFALDILAAWGIFQISRLIRSQVISRAILIASTGYLLFIIISYHPYAIAYSNPFFKDNLSQELGWGEGLDQVANWLNINHPNAVIASWYPEELAAFTTAKVLHINAHTQNPVNYIVLYNKMFGRSPEHYANDFIDEYYKKRDPVFTATIYGKEMAWVYKKPSYTSTVGDLDAETLIVQEFAVGHDQLAGIQLLPATRFGKADTGVLHVEVTRELTSLPIYKTSIPVTSLKDSAWFPLQFPQELIIKKGEHIFVTMRASGSSSPYASIKYSKETIRTTPIYISRTGDIADAAQKTGTLAVQLLYTGTDGKIATELETKLLK